MMEDLIKKITLMYRSYTDTVKTDPKDIEQEKFDEGYNFALTSVLKLLKSEAEKLSQPDVIKSVCEHVRGSLVFQGDNCFAECKLCGKLY